MGKSKRGGFVSNLSRDKALELLALIKDKYNLSETEFVSLLNGGEENISVPVSIFNDTLSSLEVICLYLIDYKKLSYTNIAKLLNRDVSTIYQAYHFSKKKYSSQLDVSSDVKIPVSVFQDRKFSVLESIVLFMKEDLRLTNHEVASAIKRNDKTVWTVYHRAQIKKDGKGLSDQN
jgi:hypothetical protein